MAYDKLQRLEPNAETENFHESTITFLNNMAGRKWQKMKIVQNVQ